MRMRKVKFAIPVLLVAISWGMHCCKTAEIATGTAPKEIRVKDIEGVSESRKEYIQGIWVKKIKRLLRPG